MNTSIAIILSSMILASVASYNFYLFRKDQSCMFLFKTLHDGSAYEMMGMIEQYGLNELNKMQKDDIKITEDFLNTTVWQCVTR